MKTIPRIALFLFIVPLVCGAQNWTLELKSYVEYRTWKLTTKAESKETQLQGATIKLFQGAKLVSQVTTDADGEFTLLVPPNGEFTGEVSYPGCNTKRFTVSTMGVPEKVGTDDYKPTHTVKGGFVMVKPYPSIDYKNLDKSLIKISYLPSLQNFDDERDATNTGLGLVGEIYDAENILFEKFCAKNREGDAALKIPDCPLARKLYNEAIAIIPNEEYPVEQLKKVGACLKDMEDAGKKAKETAEAKEKARLEQLDKDKAEAERISKENEAKEKANKERLEAQKVAKENAALEKEKARKKTTEDEEAEKARKKVEDDELAKKKKKDEEDEQSRKKKKADDDDIAKKKKQADEEEQARKRKATEDEEAYKRKQKGKTDDLIKGTPNGNTDKIIGGKKPADHGDEEMDATGSKHRPVRKMIGVDHYKAYIVKGNDFFKHKRYEEARDAYKEALLGKPDDPYATTKLAEIETILKK